MTLNNRAAATVFLALMSLSVGLNVVLSRQVVRLRDKIKAVKEESHLQPGTAVPPIPVQTVNGESAYIDYGEVDCPTILYVLNPSCRWCELNNASLLSLAEATAPTHRLIGLSLFSENTLEYVVEHGYTFPVYVEIPDAIRSAYRMGGTPQTIVVSPQAKVLQAWSGAYMGEVKEEIEAHFGIRLPSLPQQPDS